MQTLIKSQIYDKPLKNDYIKTRGKNLILDLSYAWFEFGNFANAPIVETKFLELAMSLLDFSPQIPLGTFSNLLGESLWNMNRHFYQDVYTILTLTLTLKVIANRKRSSFQIYFQDFGKAINDIETATGGKFVTRHNSNCNVTYLRNNRQWNENVESCAVCWN